MDSPSQLGAAMFDRQTLDALLARYDELERTLQTLERERETLRARIQETLLDARITNYAARAAETRVEAYVSVKETVTYNETKLRERLGERYRIILAPDLKKIKQHLPELGPAFAPHLELVGAPTKELVRAGIENGTLRMDEFQDAFAKVSKTTLFVRRRPVEELAAVGGRR